MLEYWRDALNVAVRRGNLYSVKRLVSKGVTIEGLDVALHEAVWYGKVKIVKYLLEQGAPVDGYPPRIYKTHLIIALASDFTSLSALPLIAHGANPNARLWESGYTALMLAVRTKNLEIVKALLEKGADVNASDEYGDNPLSFAKTKDMRDLLRRFGGKYPI